MNNRFSSKRNIKKNFSPKSGIELDGSSDDLIFGGGGGGGGLIIGGDEHGDGVFKFVYVFCLHLRKLMFAALEFELEDETIGARKTTFRVSPEFDEAGIKFVDISWPLIIVDFLTSAWN